MFIKYFLLNIMIGSKTVCSPGADPGFFPRGGSGGTQCHKDAAGVSGEGREGGLGPPPRKF